MVVTDVGGLRETVGRPGTGIVCDEGTPACIAEAIGRYFDDPALQEHLLRGHARRERAPVLEPFRPGPDRICRQHPIRRIMKKASILLLFVCTLSLNACAQWYLFPGKKKPAEKPPVTDTTQRQRPDSARVRQEAPDQGDTLPPTPSSTRTGGRTTIPTCSCWTSPT